MRKKSILWGLLLLFAFCLPTQLVAHTEAHTTAAKSLSSKKRKYKRPAFAVLSDIHVGRSQSEQKVEQALRSLLSQEPRLDAIFVVGDLTHNGLPEEYEKVKALFSMVPSDISTYFVMGNHDRYNDSGDINGLTHFEKTLGQPVSQYIEHKGYPFILVNMASKKYPYYTEEEVKFLEISLEKAAHKYPRKPIFVFCHVPPQNTVYGSGAQEGWGSPTLYDSLKKYPQAIVFSGHSHFPVVDERSIHQKDFTTVNVGSTAYTELERGFSEGIHPPYNNNVTEAVVAKVKRKNKVELHRIDTYRNEPIRKPWVLKSPHHTASFAYTQAHADRLSPQFDVDASIEIVNITDDSCDFIFPQASDNHAVHHYVVDIIRTDNAKVYKRYTVSSQYYLNTAQPALLPWKATGLEGETSYKVRILAIDSFGNTSQPISSAYFTTPKFVPTTAFHLPQADLLDLAFHERSAVDRSGLGQQVIYQGYKNNTRFDEELNCYVADFKGDSNTFYQIPIADVAELQSKLQEGFTIEIYYKSNDLHQAVPMGCMSQGGLAIVQSYLGVPQLSLELAGRKQLVGNFTFAPKQYNHYVFTYQDKVMRAYTNAIPTGVRKVYAAPSLPQDSKYQWLAIGGNCTEGNAVSQPLDGSIAFVRIYNKALSRDEAFFLYQLMQNRMELKNMAEFNQLISESMPRRIAEVTNQARKEKLQRLIEEGWRLMISHTTTQEQVDEFIHEAKMSF